MSQAVAQVAHPDELPELHHDNDNNKEFAKEFAKMYAEARMRDRQHQNEVSGLNAAGFAYGRRNAILELMRMRFGGSCLTDDAELFAELLIPFIVEAALLHRLPDDSRRDPVSAARACLGHALPLWMKEHGEKELPGMVAQAIADREAAIAAHDPAQSRHVHWLPTMAKLVEALRPTREEARYLRGWGCIDPASEEERREADRMRKRAERARKGATPRKESISARKPWEALGISRASWYRRQREGQTVTPETVSSGPLGEYGADVSVSPPELPAITDNDVEPVQAPPSPVEAGFTGRNINLSAAIVSSLAEQHPHLAPIRLHLEEIDATLNRTPERDRRVVLNRRLRSRHISASRAATTAAKRAANDEGALTAAA